MANHPPQSTFNDIRAQRCEAATSLTRVARRVGYTRTEWDRGIGKKLRATPGQLWPTIERA